jgi:hypothetical protein
VTLVKVVKSPRKGKKLRAVFRRSSGKEFTRDFGTLSREAFLVPAAMDKFYTNDDVASAAVASFFEHVTVDSDSVIVEPSAGGGAFLVPLQGRHSRVFGYDIDPSPLGLTRGVLPQDFLEWRPVSPPVDGEYHFVGNPPFGYQRSLANKFIKHACKFARSVAFILPVSFTKPWLQAPFHELFHLVHEQLLPPRSYNENGKVVSVKCVWQIWVKQDTPRPPLSEAPDPIGYHVTKATETPSLKVKNTGVSAGRVDEITTEDHTTRNHNWTFVTVDSPEVGDAIRASSAEMLALDCLNTGPRCISRRVMVPIMNRYTCRVLEQDH